MSAPTETPGYTGLDLQAAYTAVFPATAETIRFQDINHSSQNKVKRVARAIAAARAEGRAEIGATP